MPEQPYVNPDLRITVNGRPLEAAILETLQALEVHSDLDLPAMFALTFQDNDLRCLDGEAFKLGAALEIKLRTAPQADRASVEAVLIQGEITALEPEFSQAAVLFTVRGYTKQHRLQRGTHTKVWAKTTDADIARQSASQAGLRATVDATSEKYPSVFQHNQTDLEFLRARAERIGYQIYVEGGELFFKKGAAPLKTGPELIWKENLIEFRPRLSVANQVAEVQVRGWDPKAKQALSGKAKTDGSLGLGQWQASSSARNGSALVVVDDEPVASAAEAETVARAVLAQVNESFLQAEGACFGDPRLQAGQKVKVSGVGGRLSGDYILSSVRHTWSHGHYETHFAVSGRRPETVADLLGAGEAGRADRLYGVVTALVTSNNIANDGEHSGNDWAQVKVKFPWLDDTANSHWARLAAPMAGAERGFLTLPEVNDEVLVAFEHGDFDRPYIVGALWNGKDKPPLPISQVVKDGKVVQRVFKSRAGHVFILDDTDGQEQIILRDKTGKNEIILSSKDNTLTVHTEKDVIVQAKGKLNLKADQDISIEGQNVTIKSQQALKLEAGGAASLKATQSATVEGTSGVTVKNAAAQIALSGPTVSVNNGALEVM